MRFSLATIVFETFELILCQMLSSQGKNAPSNPYPHYLVRLATSRNVAAPNVSREHRPFFWFRRPFSVVSRPLCQQFRTLFRLFRFFRVPNPEFRGHGSGYVWCGHVWRTPRFLAERIFRGLSFLSRRIFFADSVAGFFLLIFVGKSSQKNPQGKSPAKSSRIYTTKTPDNLLQRDQAKDF